MSSRIATPTLFENSPATTTRSVYAPTLLVSVPRAVFEQYWPLPWVEVLAAAEHGRDGLTIERDLPDHWMGHEGEKNERPDVAFLREGDGQWKGRTLLYQQNWGKDAAVTQSQQIGISKRKIGLSSRPPMSAARPLGAPQRTRTA